MFTEPRTSHEHCFAVFWAQPPEVKGKWLLCFKYPVFLEQVLFRNTFQWPIPAGRVFKHFTSRMQSLQAFCSWLEAISSREEGGEKEKKKISTATFSMLRQTALWRNRLHGNCKPMDQCTICKDVLKHFGATFFSLYVSTSPVGGKIVWFSCSGKGKLNDRTPGASKAAGQRVGGSVQSHCLGVGKAQVSFLACLVLLEPCLGFVYRDVFCLTK